MTTAVASTTTSSSASSTIASGASTLSSSYETFLTLLTTQLKNQDPTSPLDTNAFTQQLVQMTGVQQQLLSNQLLQQLVNQSAGGQGLASSANLIGKTVSIATGSNTLTNGSASWQYTLGGAATSATGVVTNSAGTVVWSGPLSGLANGVNSFTWNGKDSTGRQLADGGTYKLTVSAANANGASVTANTSITGAVTGVSQDSTGQTIVNIGKVSGPLSKLTSISST
jgi:flagellar basal-body rod modification protein FlgD